MWVGAVLGVGCAATPPATPRAGEDSGRASFESLTFPPTQLGIFDTTGAPVTVWGDLKIPPATTRPLPAVVIMHGAGGLTPNLPRWAEHLERLEIASLVVDSFTPRGITEVRTGNARINIASRVVDAYRALEVLAAHPRVDPQRIALMGFSHGGGVVLLARQRRLQRLWMAGERRFAAFLAFYPALCNVRLLDDEQAAPRPLRIFSGTADDQTIIGPCREYVARMREAGQDVALLEYPDAQHGFDIRGALGIRQPQVISGRNCVFVERAPGSFEVTHRDTGKPSHPGDPCMTRGITVGYSARAHEQSIQDVTDFLATTLALKR